MRVGVLAAALVLDLAFGDPDGPWHPVRLMGALITWAEAQARRDRRRLKLRGVGVVLLVLGLSYGAGLLILHWAAAMDDAMGFDGWASFAAQALIVWSCLGLKSMLQHAETVLSALSRGDLAAARAAVAHIVGRDVEDLDEIGVCRACLESVAESLGDGVMGPLFFAALGGAPFALVYRAANTLDSMLGHRDEHYLELGWASARTDDVLSWIPARKAALFAMVGAACVKLDFRSSWRVARRDASNQASPNSGWPEAAFAGALGVRLGGPLTYDGVRVDRAFMGDDKAPLSVSVCRRGLQLFLAACVAAVCVDELLAFYGLH